MKDLLSFVRNYGRKWQTWLVILLIVCAFSRFYRLGAIHEYIFDEVYHAFTAKMYALNRYEAWVWWTNPPEGVAYEWTHPPLAKVIMSWGIQMFGGPGAMPNRDEDPGTLLTPSSFGWRFFPAVFGVLGTFALFLFVKSIFRNPWIGLLAAFLFTFDLLPLVQSRTAMNDIFAVTFILFTYYFFTKRKSQQDGITYAHPILNYRLPIYYWILTALFLGMALASKWTSLFTIGLLGFYQFATIVYYFVSQRESKKNIWLQRGTLLLKQAGLGLVSFLLIPLIIYLLSYWQLFTLPIDDFQGNTLSQSLESMHSRMDYLKTVEANAKDYKASPELRESYKKDMSELSMLRKEIPFFQFLKPHNPYLTERLFIVWGLQKQMWWYHTNLKATHNYTSQWWTWPMDIRPVWFYVKYCGATDTNKDAACERSLQATGVDRTIGDVYTMGNPFIFWLILPLIGFLGYTLSGRYRNWLYAIIPASLLLLLQYNLTFSRPAEAKSLFESIGATAQFFVPQLILFSLLLILFLLFLQLIDFAWAYIKAKSADLRTEGFFSTPFADILPLFLSLLIYAGYWLPWSRSPRIMFFYHFFPPVTFFYPLLAYSLFRLYKSGKYRRFLFWGYLAVVVISFVYFYPHVTGALVTDTQRENYFWLSSWK